MSFFEQADIFESGDLYFGLNHLSNLEFDNAILFLKKAEKYQAGDAATISAALKSAYYWKQFLEEKDRNDISVISSFLNQLEHYAFPDSLHGLKKGLLSHILNLFSNQNADEKDIFSFYELLMKEKDYEKAEQLTEGYLEKHPEDYRFYYLLAKAEYKNNQSAKAQKDYLRAFLHYPEKKMLPYVEHPKLKKWTEKYPLEMIPAYACLKGAGSFVSVKEDIKLLDDNHQKAIESYKLLRQCFVADMKRTVAVEHRRQLQEINPELFDAYMNNKKGN